MSATTSAGISQHTEGVAQKETPPSSQIRAKAKSEGIHYTPPALAAFLAKLVAERLTKFARTADLIHVLDPACGDGELLRALAEAVPQALRSRMVLTGFDKDEDALLRAKQALAAVDVHAVELHCGDFLMAASGCFSKDQMSLMLAPDQRRELQIEGRFDAVISNPPYVRTQVLGSKVARKLATRFDLSGRVDLYHAFIKAMTSALRDGGTLGLLTSNRFLCVQSGACTRDWLMNHFRLLRLVDLGDTKLFSAAVLPAILVAERDLRGAMQDCEFIRVYETPNSDPKESREYASILDALDGSFEGIANVDHLQFKVERGRLRTHADNSMPWSMTSPELESWLETIRRHSEGEFSEFGKVCVGIKTTADSVFIRDDWDELPEQERPEETLLRPLITHHTASRWCQVAVANASRYVLYPYTVTNSKRVPVDLSRYPRARAYLEQHRDLLEGRTYVMNSGRQWYEIWVPHHPSDWDVSKIAFPDIGVTGTFFVADKGQIVNGDCYWIKLFPGVKEKWLWLMLAVANSSFVLKYYDAVFHNKLYSGRRRFMSQYVARFPLPKLERSAEILGLMPDLLKAASDQGTGRLADLEGAVDDLVWKAFGLSKEITR